MNLCRGQKARSCARLAFLLAILLFLGEQITFSQSEIFVATNGSDANSGTKEAPLATLIGARDKIREIKNTTGIPAGGLTVWIREGRYPVTSTLNLSSEDSGSGESNPIIYSGHEDETVILDGSKNIGASGFEIVSEAGLINKLHQKGKGKVLVKKITDASMIEVLKETTAQLSINDKMMSAARFPNIGFGHVNQGTIDVSTEEIRVNGTIDTPKGGKFKLHENIDGQKWKAEISRVHKTIAKGYYSAHWYKGTSRVHSVDDYGAIQLMDGSRYGLKNLIPSPSRMFFQHLLCELDEPGEWYFDNTDNNLYLWPYEDITESTAIGVWAGPECFNLQDVDYVSIRNMVIQCLGKGNNGDGAIDVRGTSSYIEVAGVTFRYISEPILALNFWHDTKNCTAQSCDFYDIPNCTRLYGGKRTSTSVTRGNNKFENCHFTQVYSKDFYGKACGISGVGQTFRNNMIHNMNGQVVTHTGVDHLLELNEVFNTGIEEGDGGAFYTGNDVSSYGNVIQHNFMHHMMSVPKLLGRASFYSDDMDGGEAYLENVLYKGGWETIKMNAGGGHDVFRNVAIECYTAIWNKDGGSGNYNKYMDYINNNPQSTDKENYIGRMLQKIGKPGWETSVNSDNWTSLVEDYWLNRYPKMGIVFNKYFTEKNVKAFECRYYDNLFYGNVNKIRGGSGSIRDSKDITLDVFENPDLMNFKFKSPLPEGYPNIPFEDIGLYVDEYRKSTPLKGMYRKAIKDHFAHLACHTNDPYDINTINKRLYFNTGKLVMRLIPSVTQENPQVEFITPESAETYLSGSDLKVNVNAIDIDGIKYVKLFLDDVLVRQIDNLPYEWGRLSDEDEVLKKMEAGTYTFKVEAADSKDNVTTESVTITVEEVANIAVNKPSQQSSNNYTDKAFAEMANDGNTDGVFANGSCNHTKNDKNAWWQVDLRNVYNIKAIRVWNRVEAADRLANFYVFVTEKPFLSTSLQVTREQPLMNEFFTVGQCQYPTVIPVEKEGRFVRVQLSGTNILNMAEVEVLTLEDDNAISLTDLIGLKVYPNPLKSGNLRITKDVSGASVDITILDLSGKAVLNKKMFNQELLINRNDFEKPGMYILKMLYEGKVDMKKVVVM